MKMVSFYERALYTQELMSKVNEFLAKPNIEVTATHVVPAGEYHIVAIIFYKELGAQP